MRSSPDEADRAGGSREGSELYIARARESLRLAEAELLPARQVIHMKAAERWIQFAERARRIEARSHVAARPCPA